MRQRDIIIFITILFLASSLWLFYVSDKFLDPNSGKNWWVLSFENLTSSDLNFVIENHSDQTSFHWVILQKNQKIREGNLEIEKGKTIQVNPEIQSKENLEGKIVIEVYSGQEKKEIYKNL